MRIIIIGLLLALISLQYKLWLGDGSLPQWIQLKEKLATQKEENKKLTSRNRILMADILELKSGTRSLEEQARSELGMIKDDEIYYHFMD